MKNRKRKILKFPRMLTDRSVCQCRYFFCFFFLIKSLSYVQVSKRDNFQKRKKISGNLVDKIFFLVFAPRNNQTKMNNVANGIATRVASKLHNSNLEHSSVYDSTVQAQADHVSLASGCCRSHKSLMTRGTWFAS